MKTQVLENYFIQDITGNTEFFSHIKCIFNARFELYFFIIDFFVAFRKNVIRVFSEFFVHLNKLWSNVQVIRLSNIKETQVLPFAFKDVFKMVKKIVKDLR